MHNKLITVSKKKGAHVRPADEVKAGLHVGVFTVTHHTKLKAFFSYKYKSIIVILSLPSSLLSQESALPTATVSELVCMQSYHSRFVMKKRRPACTAR